MRSEVFVTSPKELGLPAGHSQLEAKHLHPLITFSGMGHAPHA